MSKKRQSEIQPTEYYHFSDYVQKGLAKFPETIARWERRAVDPFPARIHLTSKCIIWKKADVDAWIERRIQSGSKQPDVVARAKSNKRAAIKRHRS